MSDRLQIARGGFAGAAFVGHDLIGDLSALRSGHAGVRPCSTALDMDENVGAAGVRLNEPEALRCIEPFHCARRHDALLSNRPTNLAEPPFIARRGGSSNRRYGCCQAAEGRARVSGNDAIVTWLRGHAMGRLESNR